MRLAFFCGALEPGRDGVGDYCRRLAAECIRQGHSCMIGSLNDPHITEVRREFQEMDGASISVLRMPGVIPWEQRIIEVRNLLARFNPDWTSLQFVPFGFHRKGLCFGLGKMLHEMNSRAQWNVMFHELWLGLGENSPVKHRVVGALQRRIILDMLNRLRPRLVTTQTEIYRTVLARERIGASILPLFGNIPFAAGDGWTSILEPLVSEAAGKSQARNNVYLAGVLGGVHPEWNVEDAVKVVSPLVKRFKKRLVLVFHGKNNLPPEAFVQMKRKLQDRADVVVTGERPGAEISRILQTLDLGLATSPRQIIQKSGSAAAMLEHGLTVLVTRDDWRLRGASSTLEENSSRLLSPEQFASLETPPLRDSQPPEVSGVTNVAGKMLAAMNSPSRAVGKPAGFAARAA